MGIIDFVFWLLIKLSHGVELGVISVVGYLFINRRAFGLTIFITVFSMVLNAYLKSVWQVPLNPELGLTGWAFPSGHTQTSAVFWFMLTLLLGIIWMVYITPLIILGIMFGIVHFGYHDWPDILGALSFAGLIIIFFHYLIRVLDKFKLSYYWMGLILSLLEILLINFALPMAQHNYIWLKLGIGVVVGISLGWMISENVSLPQIVNNKILSFVLLGCVTVLFSLILSKLNSSEFNEWVKAITIGFTISFIIPLIDRGISIYKQKLKVKN